MKNSFSEAKKLPVKEMNLSQILKDFAMNTEEFVDLCILLGCDYTSTIRGIGPKKAFDLIKKHRCIENVLENLDQTKYAIPENWKFKEARRLFLEPEVMDCEDLQLVWKDPDIEGIVQFLCGEKSFNEDRVRASLAKMQKGRQAGQQVRIDSFFSVSKVVTSETAKRKAVEEKGGSQKKRGPNLNKKMKK
ncbi:unnamed protein product [Gongylonema pulchrum]|uniref:Flap endonuclease 1 n=1 Tax=Gongylonema pulchrum TaxID=637853 RepID=A0A183D9D5_9BILA|nr:unnamed protein product [Gongylonema pulchrum]